MSDCGEDHASLTEIVCPARDRFSAQVPAFADVSQAIDILTSQQNIPGILVVRHEMLFVVNDEILHAARNRMFLVHYRHLKGTQSRMIDVRATHHLAIVLGRKRNVTAVVQGVQRTPSLHEVFDGCTLLLRDPGLGPLLRPVPTVLQLVRVFAVVRLKIPLGPDYSIAQHDKESVGREEPRGYLVVVNGVIDRQIQLAKKSIQRYPNIVGVVIAVANESKDASTVVVGRDAAAHLPLTQEDLRRR